MLYHCKALGRLINLRPQAVAFACVDMSVVMSKFVQMHKVISDSILPKVVSSSSFFDSYIIFHISNF